MDLLALQSHLSQNLVWFAFYFHLKTHNNRCGRAVTETSMPITVIILDLLLSYYVGGF